MATLEEAIAVALDHHLAGRAAEAELLYGRILDAVPDHPDTLHLYGLLCAQSGRLEEAAGLLRRAVAQRPGSAEYRANLAKTHRAAGRTADAAVEYREAVRLCPDSSELSFTLALLERDLGRPAEAVAAFRRTVLAQPDLAEAYLQAGALLRHAGRLDEAVTALSRAVRLRPDHAPALHHLGVALQRKADPAAVAVLRRTVPLDPLDPQIRLNLGRALAGLRAWREAADALAGAAAIDPASPDVWRELGHARWQSGDPGGGAASLCRSVRLDPAPVVSWCALGMAAAEAGNREAAGYAIRRALALDPAHADSLGKQAVLTRDRHDLAGAVTLHDRTVALVPASADQRWNRSLTRLMAGDHGGWEDYEARWSAPGFPTKPRGFAQPLWTGGPLGGLTLLLHEEQGRGDAIQFVRYAPLAAARGARVILEAGADLVPLFRSLEGVADVVASGCPLPPFDLHCPLLSLPRAFATTAETVPAAIPYLRPDPVRAAVWKERLAGDGLRVGLIWAGNPQFAGDRERSPGLAVLRPLLEVPGCRFFGLQMGAGRAELTVTVMPPAFADLGPLLGDFADTAAAMVNLDLVISSCTAPAHLAGALGVPVWVLLSHTPDWRWHLGRSDSPWYPTARLFRQPEPGDWAAVTRAVAGALERTATGYHGSDHGSWPKA